MILEGEFQNIFASFAPVCSSWSIVNRATSQRTILTPYGNTASTNVIRGNRMASRTAFTKLWFVNSECKMVDHGIYCSQWHSSPIIPQKGLPIVRTGLLAILLACLNSTFIIENPGSSAICWHPGLLWALKCLHKAGKRAPWRAGLWIVCIQTM